MLYFARESLFLINFCLTGFLFFFLLNLILPLSNSLYISLLCHLFQRLPHLSTFPFGFFICCFTWGILLTHQLSCHLSCILMTPQASRLLTLACYTFLSFSCLSEVATCTPKWGQCAPDTQWCFIKQFIIDISSQSISSYQFYVHMGGDFLFQHLT